MIVGLGVINTRVLFRYASWVTIGIALTLASTANALVILQYHHISEETPQATSVSPIRFGQHLRHLQEAGYQVQSLPVMIQRLRSGEKLPDKSVVITFDDGYESVFTEAFPLLKAKAWPFTVFVNTQPLQQDKSGFASWAQLREMAEHGATIANHSHTHAHFLRRLDDESIGQWRTRIRAEIEIAESLIAENTGQNHKLLAYPYGEYDLAIKSLVKSLGFTAFGQQSGPVPRADDGALDFLALPRFPFGGIYGGEEDFKTKVATLPLPIESVTLLDKPKGSPLRDTLLPSDVDRPVLNLKLNTQASVQCFASGQGSIDVESDGINISARAGRALPVGRSRYNCTAASGESGRFFWYSHFFIRKRADGTWYPEP